MRNLAIRIRTVTILRTRSNSLEYVHRDCQLDVTSSTERMNSSFAYISSSLLTIIAALSRLKFSSRVGHESGKSRDSTLGVACFGVAASRRFLDENLRYLVDNEQREES